MKYRLDRYLSISGVLASALVLATCAQAAETAQVMPFGISRLRLIGVATATITEKYNSDGVLEPVAHSLDRSLTTTDYIAREPRLARLVNALDGLEPGLGEKLLSTNLYGNFQTTQRQYVLGFESGLTPELSFGFKLPIIRREVRAGLDVATSNQADAIAAKVGRLDPDLSQGIFDVGAKRLDQAFFENAIFTSKGYEAPQEFTRTQLGDIEFGLKRKVIDNGPFMASALVGARIPLGVYRPINNAFDTGSGDGCWATGVQTYQEYKLNRYFTVGSMQKAGYFFADTRPRAVPKDADDSLPSLLPEDGQVRDVRRQQSIQYEAEISSTLNIPNTGWSASSALQFATQAPAAYTLAGPGDGGAADLYYAGMSQGTGFARRSLELGAQYSTVPSFLAKRFALPMDIEFLYNMVLFARNEPLARYGRLDFKVYF